MDELVALLDAELRRFVDRLSGWTVSRWSARTCSPPGLMATAPVRAEVAAHLVQRLADLDAELEGRPHLPVPPLDNENGLADQIMVCGHDLVVYAGRAQIPAHRREQLLAAALGEVLLHRYEIDGSEPADGPARATLAVLGGDDVHEGAELLAVLATHCPERDMRMR